MKLNKKVKGFSILELMIVVTIIGILASVAVQKWREYQSKTRDNIRKLALGQMAKALEVYYMKHRSYPSTGDQWWGYVSSFRGKEFTGANGYIPNLAPKYIDQLPKDPLEQDPECTNCGYIYKSDGAGYKLMSHHSPEIYPKSGEPFYDPQHATWAIMVCEGTVGCAYK